MLFKADFFSSYLLEARKVGKESKFTFARTETLMKFRIDFLSHVERGIFGKNEKIGSFSNSFIGLLL
jgi:hypothetical protein